MVLFIKPLFVMVNADVMINRVDIHQKIQQLQNQKIRQLQVDQHLQCQPHQFMINLNLKVAYQECLQYMKNLSIQEFQQIQNLEVKHQKIQRIQVGELQKIQRTQTQAYQLQ